MESLYKRLNAERTQGKWEFDDSYSVTLNPNISVRQEDNRIHVVSTVNDYFKEATANAKYTALAVNNLHILAEALEKIADNGEKHFQRYADGKGVDFKQLAGAMIETAKEALKRIS